MTVSDNLDAAAHRAEQIAAQWRSRLIMDDQIQLATAFHRAESLAHTALRQAIEQVSPDYHGELMEQLDDETRNVDVFAGWHHDAPAPIREPKTKHRTEPVWFALLLVNEIAGFCQFHMLSRLVDDPAKAAAVAEVAADERVHVARLVRWLQPYVGRPAGTEVTRIVDSFRERLPGRMKQFLPRAELAGLRGEMAAVIDDALAALVPG